MPLAAHAFSSFSTFACSVRRRRSWRYHSSKVGRGLAVPAVGSKIRSLEAIEAQTPRVLAARHVGTWCAVQTHEEKSSQNSVGMVHAGVGQIVTVGRPEPG